jgi:cytochrome oxidase assembly protein ShyY1
MPPEKHLGYAIQWFGLAIAAALIGGFAIMKKGRQYE